MSSFTRTSLKYLSTAAAFSSEDASKNFLCSNIIFFISSISSIIASAEESSVKVSTFAFITFIAFSIELSEDIKSNFASNTFRPDFNESLSALIFLERINRPFLIFFSVF